MKTIPNYSTKVIEFFHAQGFKDFHIEAVKAHSMYVETNNERDLMRSTLFSELDLLETGECEHFWVNDTRLLFFTDFTNEDVDGMRLPYPRMVLEYNIAPEKTDEELAEVDKSQARRRATLLLENSGGTGFSCTPFWYDEVHKVWASTVIPAFVGYEDLWAGKILREDGIHIHSTTMADKFKTIVGPHLLKTILTDIVEDMVLAIKFLGILACSNVDRERVPAPRNLNKKRQKRGKTLLPDYHVLRIGTSGKVHSRTVETESSQAHKRTHWRRGHRRKYKTGNVIWIAPMMINAGQDDLLRKDYCI